MRGILGQNRTKDSHDEKVRHSASPAGAAHHLTRARAELEGGNKLFSRHSGATHQRTRRENRSRRDLFVRLSVLRPVQSADTATEKVAAEGRADGLRSSL